MSASAAPARLACALARMLFSRLQWWILLSRQDGGFLRVAAVTRRTPVLS